MYYQAFSYGHFGYGAAIGLVLFLIILLITGGNNGLGEGGSGLLVVDQVQAKPSKGGG